MGGVWRPIAIVATLLVVLTILLAQSRSPDRQVYERMHEALGKYELHDAELTRDVLTARAGLLPHYDPLAYGRGRLHETLGELRRESAAGSPEAAAILREPIEALQQAQGQKLVDVEHFKSVNALLRNSLLYLTYVGPVLDVPEARNVIAAEAGRLSYSVLRFMQAPDPGIGAEIEAVLDRLAGAAGFNPELMTVVAHGRLIISLVPRTDELMRKIVAAPTGARARELRAAVLLQSERVEARAQVFRVSLYAVALLLLGYVVLQFVRLRAGAQALRRTNASLEREMEERARAAAALRASEARFRAMSESAKEAIVSVDEAGNIVSWNAGAASTFGYSAGQILGQHHACLAAPAFRRAQERAFADLLEPDHAEPGAATREIAGLRQDGREIPLEVSLSTWTTGEGRFLTAIMRDISERRRLEETARQQELQLIQANRMGVLGMMVSGVAHEINNPIQSILINSVAVAKSCKDLLALLESRDVPPRDATIGGLPYPQMLEDLPVALQDIQDEARKIGQFAAELKYFYRSRAPGSAELFDINDAARRAVRLLNHKIKERTGDFRADFAPQLPAVRGDAQQFEQVVVNLVVNALEALPGKECAVSLATSYDASRQSLSLLVEDQGSGIAAVDLARVCDPFFTTKQASGGTGLGLAITSNLLKNVGGRLRFESRPGKGTRAIVELAVAAQASGSVAQADMH